MANIISTDEFDKDLQAATLILTFLGYRVADAPEVPGQEPKPNTVSKVVEVQRPWNGTLTLSGYRTFNRKLDAFLTQLEMLNLVGEPTITEVQQGGTRWIRIQFVASLVY